MIKYELSNYIVRHHDGKVAQSSVTQSNTDTLCDFGIAINTMREQLTEVRSVTYIRTQGHGSMNGRGKNGSHDSVPSNLFRFKVHESFISSDNICRL
jgi:hypothetical protein